MYRYLYTYYKTTRKVVFSIVLSFASAPQRYALRHQRRRQIATVIRSDVHPPRGRARAHIYTHIYRIKERDRNSGPEDYER